MIGPPFQQQPMMPPQYLQYQQQMAAHQFNGGAPFMPMMPMQPSMQPPMAPTSYYQQAYAMPVRHSSMQQQMPPMMMPPGWKHPRYPPQIDGFCCKKKEQAVRESRVGKHPHNKNCPVRMWAKEKSKKMGFYV